MNYNSCFISFFIVFSFLSCQKETKNYKEISLERWTVSGDSNEYKKDVIQYLETVQYNDDGLEISKLLYNQDKQLASKEIRILDEKTKFPKGSQYKTASDSLLSFYLFKTNANGLVTESRAFDALTNEPLRVEEFLYNDQGKLQQKTIKDIEGVAVRKFIYTLDKYGNELEVQVLGADGSELLVEQFKITKFDKQNNWIEKWGFVKNEPFSYVARKITYQQ